MTPIKLALFFAVLGAIIFSNAPDAFLIGNKLVESASIQSRVYNRLQPLSMAIQEKARRAANAAGNLFVDESCINCDVCRWMAPDTFGVQDAKSFVYKQPITEEAKIDAFAAMVTCPVGSIRSESPDPIVKKVIEENIPRVVHMYEWLPIPANKEGTKFESEPLRVRLSLPGVYHLGYHSPKSFGATPYLIVTDEATLRETGEEDEQDEQKGGKEGGKGAKAVSMRATSGSDGLLGVNVMVDCPRYSRRLARWVEAKGGIDHMVLTHKDDLADQALWRQHFPHMKRWLHRMDITQETKGVKGGMPRVERCLEGWGPWDLVDDGLNEYEVEDDDDEDDDNGNEKHTQEEKGTQKKGEPVAVIKGSGSGRGSDSGGGGRRVRGQQKRPLVRDLFKIYYTPGHTHGHVSLKFDPNQLLTTSNTEIGEEEDEGGHSEDEDEDAFLQAYLRNQQSKRLDTCLFTGDHLAYVHRLDRLDGFGAYNKGSMDLQYKSMLDLMEVPFDWLLPGHGRWVKFPNERSRVLAIKDGAEKFIRSEGAGFFPDYLQ